MPKAHDDKAALPDDSMEDGLATLAEAAAAPFGKPMAGKPPPVVDQLLRGR